MVKLCWQRPAPAPNPLNFFIKRRNILLSGDLMFEFAIVKFLEEKGQRSGEPWVAN